MAVITLVIGAGPALAAPCPAPDNVTRVTGGGECLIAKTFAGGTGGGRRVLFVLLHGNHTSGSPATSLYGVAESLAGRAGAGAVAVALIRPGYNDAEGNFSSGNAAGRADNFTADNIDIIAGAIATLKAFHGAGRVVLVGHSGGAAMAGVLLGRHPGLADAAVLAACPCDVPRWRAMKGRGAWTSESPDRYVDRVPMRTRVAVLVGGDDTETAPVLSRDYAAALARRGIAAELAILDGIGHAGIIAAPALVEAALRLATPE
jgi:pimeloyl-ACP methyl ester carboxylesterase